MEYPFIFFPLPFLPRSKWACNTRLLYARRWIYWMAIHYGDCYFVQSVRYATHITSFQWLNEHLSVEHNIKRPIAILLCQYNNDKTILSKIWFRAPDAVALFWSWFCWDVSNFYGLFLLWLSIQLLVTIIRSKWKKKSFILRWYKLKSEFMIVSPFMFYPFPPFL